MSTNTTIAFTHLRARKKQTIIAMLGVTFGIAMFIFMISFMTGANKFLEETALSSTPHLHIFNEIKADRPTLLDERYPSGYLLVVHHQRPREEKKNLRNPYQILQVLRNDPRVQGVSPLVSTQVFFNYGSLQLNGMLQGVGIMAEDQLFDLKSKMKAGQLEDLLTAHNGVIMGSGLAKKLNVRKGDKVRITTASGAQMQLHVVGILQMGIATIDNVRSYTTLQTVQRILQQNTRYITDINLTLKDLNQARALSAEYEANFGYRAEDWETVNATILVSFTIRNTITFAVVFTLLTVAGFGIYNILNMTIYDKMKDIAILKATGFSGPDVLRIFMTQALTIGAVGGTVGLLFGFLMSYAVSKVPFDGGDFMSLDHLPMNFDPMFYVFGIVFGLLTTGLAGYFPSRRAAKIDPVEILRG